jgi:anti-anti-sigma factor
MEQAIGPGSPRGARPGARQAPPARAAELPYALSATLRQDGDRVVVTLCGELDLDAEAVLREAVGQALRRSRTGVDLDMARIAFWDCSALNVLLDLRCVARRDGKTLAVRAAGPAVTRLLELTGTGPLFLPGGDGLPPDAAGSPADAGGEAPVPGGRAGCITGTARGN